MRAIFLCKWALILCCCTGMLTSASAQVAISESDAVPNASAILDLQSSDRGFLVPRVTTAQRTGIANPAAGLLVYDMNTYSFWYFENLAWKEIEGGIHDRISDDDGDTQVLTEKNNDEDRIRFEVNGEAPMTIRENRVGIGIINPISTLHLRSDSTNVDLTLERTSDGYPSQLIFKGGSTQFNVGSPAADRFRITAAGKESFTIDPDGNVGIGFASPDSKLTIRDSSAAALTFKSYDNSAPLGIAFKNVGTLFTWSMHRQDAGSNKADLVFAGGASADPALLPERMRIKNTGEVGIGTSAPDQALHVVGNIKMEDGNESMGKILVSDTSGVASWADPNTSLAVPDTALPIPIRYHGDYLYVSPVDNADSLAWQMAIDTCASLVAYGFDDWYLPTKLELDAMYKQSYLITGLSQTKSAKYWSATALDDTYAYTQRLDYGGPDPDDKALVEGYHCRCVRKD